MQIQVKNIGYMSILMISCFSFADVKYPIYPSYEVGVAAFIKFLWQTKTQIEPSSVKKS